MAVQANRTCAAIAAVCSAGLAMLAGAATAQTEPRPALQRQVIDLGNLKLALPREETPENVIDFENAQGPQAGAGIRLTTQYAQSHGVTFGRGASVHFCRPSSDDVMASLCPYRSAASGQRVAAHEVRLGGAAMLLNFSRPVESMSMRINPTGGILDEVFVAEISGFDAAGEEIVQSTSWFNWYQDAFSWPTSVGFETDAGRVVRASITLRRVARNNQPVRFLIDDLSLLYAPESTLPPVAEALAEDDRPPRAQGEIVQSTEIGAAQDALRLYPAATRRRAAIDWDAVERALDAQKDQGLAPMRYQGGRFVSRAELPVLLPMSADAGSVIVVGNRDSYTAHFQKDGRAYSLYGSRLLTLMKPARGAVRDETNLTLMRSDEALTASFALYGASYSLTRHCLNEDAASDAACHDADAMGEVAADLVVVVGEAARRRP
ncbi:MAG: hypothetical protein ACX939_02050 [Hyphococcus sp.]